MEGYYFEIYINTKPKKVWNAFIGENQFFKSFYGANIKSTFKIGDRIEYSGEYKGKKTVHIYGEILEYEEERLLAYTDHPGPMYNENHAELVSRIRVTFEPFGQSTKLTLTNDRFSKNNPMKEKVNQWYLILSNLKTYVETGELMKLE